MKLLMVCLGNICRSPLAEGIMQTQIDQHQLDWTVDSAGTGSWHVGNLPDPRSIDVARKHGLDITHQRARQLKAADLEEFDLIFAMDSSNYQNILRLATTEAQREKVKLIMNMERPGYNESVPDPYYEADGFEAVYEMLVRACEGVIKEWRSNNLSL